MLDIKVLVMSQIIKNKPYEYEQTEKVKLECSSAYCRWCILNTLDFKNED